MKNLLIMLLLVVTFISCDSPRNQMIFQLKKKYPKSMIYQVPDQSNKFLLQDSLGLHYVDYHYEGNSEYSIITLYNLN